jgi:hypothetical protein
MTGLSGPIAQLDRVPDYESGGRGFESSSVHHFEKTLLDISGLPANFVQDFET